MGYNDVDGDGFLDTNVDDDVLSYGHDHMGVLQNGEEENANLTTQ